MKHLLVALLFPLLVRGCDGFFLSPVIPPAAVTPTLALYDRAGRPSSVFHSGEDFEMRLVIVNSLREDVCYSYTPPLDGFQIFSGDSLVAASYFGMAFIQMFMEGCLRGGETYRTNWIAPNWPGRDPHWVLPPGFYTAKAFHPALRDGRARPLRPVRFVVIR